MKELKEAGNEAHRHGNHMKAIGDYTRALELIGENRALANEAAVFLSNRSAVHSAVGNIREALKDAEESVKKDPTWHKVYEQ